MKANKCMLLLLALILLTNISAIGKELISTAEWHDGDTIEIHVASTLEQTGPTVPRIRLVVGAKVDFSGDCFSFSNGSSIELRPSGSIEIAKGQSVAIGQNSTLCLQPHSISGSGTLIGNFAQIDAPMAEVFAPTVNVTGRWLNDRVYPQWFGAVAYPSLAAASATKSVCSAKSIERAAAMAVGSEVFIPVGYYAVKEAIKIPTGVKLRGASSLNFVDDHNVAETKDCFGTVLVATSFAKGKPYMIRINASKNKNWDIAYPRMCSEISHMAMFNSENSSLGAIYAADSAHLDNIVFQEFCQAVKYADIYLDNKSVTNCTFYLNSDKGRQYAFDMGFLGDALLFEHNAVHTGTFNLGIKINGCGGGSVNANIINADNLIRNSKGIVFSANHIEEGHILEIQNSQVATRSNYFWLGPKPSVQISGSEYGDQSVVSMDGDSFIFYGTGFYARQNNYKEVVANTSMLSIKADIAIDHSSCLNMSNIYRYWCGEEFGTSRACGVQVCEYLKTDEFGGCLRDFELFSYALSQGCQISPDFKVAIRFDGTGLMDATPHAFGAQTEWETWLSDTGRYTYQYQFLLDRNRRIGWTYDGTGMQKLKIQDGSTFVDSIMVDETIEKKYFDNNGIQQKRTVTKGVLISTPPIRGVIRLVRKSESSGELKYVDVPLCGAQSLYDNGVSVCGYQWKDYGINDSIELNKGVDSIEFCGDRANLFVKQIFLVGLLPSDVVYATSNKFILIQ